jgi:hypothetical protein
MDQKEIDALIAQSQGSIAEFNKKQEELIKNLAEKRETSSGSAIHKKGKVIGQLSRVTEEAEAGTNMVMGYMENVLTIISKQQSFINDIIDKYKENPEAINMNEVLPFLNDNNNVVEELIYNAMDAFQFQDIGRQKLMKVMYTLAKLNEYLNELLGGHEDRGKEFGNRIEKKTMEQDKEKVEVDNIVANFKDENSIKSNAADLNNVDAQENNPDVNSIVAEFQEKEKDSTPVDNKDIDDIIAQFQQKNKDK